MINDLHATSRLERRLEPLLTGPYPDRAVAELVNSPRSLLILSLPKSGTHWSRFLLMNYARLCKDPAAAPLTYDELGRYGVSRKFLASGRDSFAVTDPLFPDAGIDYVLHQHPVHGAPATDIWAHLGPKFCVYRNPLDFLVSCYFYYFAYREARREEAAHPRDLIPAYTRLFARSYVFLRDRVAATDHAALVSYEALKADGAATLAKALSAMALPVQHDALAAAVEYSDASAVSAQEEERGRSFFVELGEGRFVRNSSVGQWREHLDDDDVAQVTALLSERGCSLDEFDLG